MVDRIIVKPEEVRAGGNILSPAKSSSDYSLYNASITESTDTVDEQSMTVYSLAYSSPTPTPVPASLSLTSNKSILSAADSESASLTATVLDEDSEPLSGQTVTMGVYKQSDDTLVESLSVTDVGDGTYTASYLGIGAGDLYIKAECSLVSETYSIEDCFRYDDASVDNTSKYTYNNLSSLTHSVDHYEAYRSLGASDTSKYYSPIYADDTLPSDFEMSVMCKSDVMNNDQQGFTIASNHPTTYSGATELGIMWNSGRRGLFHRVNGSSTWYTENNNLPNNTWYKFILKVDGTSVTATIKDSSDNTVYTSTQTISSAQNYKKWNLTVGGYSKTLQFKNLKIKPL